ncbi:mechanosensitive channel of small conductance (MscS1F) [Vairimorpha necatrix]|uniref:Mechanosensitive channel of small conductance (MscS1F) n=1 Tax=Vairimorpha necatrix TaxID=6039 RepID=A0AAX4J9V4_9MICR
MILVPFILSVFLDLTLLFIFEISNLKTKRLLFFPLSFLHCIIVYLTYLTREKSPFNIFIKTFFRLFKFLFFFIFIHTVQEIILITYSDSLYTGLIILMILDLIRAFSYEIISRNFKSRISNEILEIEPFISNNSISNSSTSSQVSVDEFFSRGKPVSLDYDYLFDIWNDESLQINKSLAVYTQEDISLRTEAEEISKEARFFNKKSLISRKIPHKKQEKFQDLIDDKSNIDYKNDLIDIDKSNIDLIDNDKSNIDSNLISNLIDIDIDDIDDSSSDSSNFIQKKDQEANLWISINEEIRKAQPPQPKSGRITKKSLKYHFKDKSDLLYNILSFNRTEELNYLVFRDNIRQINNERENLFIVIECNRNLLSKVRHTLIFIELLVLYWFISNWLNIKPLLVELCLPIFILPAFSTLKEIIESFLFICYSHPYDPGDRIYLDNENYIVRDISLLTTTLIRWDGYKCYISNLRIKDKSITNIRRSQGQTWNLEFLIDSHTSDRKMEILQDILNRLVKEDKAYKSIQIHTGEIIDSAYIKLNILVKHKYNFQNGFLMWNNHTKFLRILSASLAIINVKYLPLNRDILHMHK